jgi:predicted ATP-dependent endonuclease of OLD family
MLKDDYQPTTADREQAEEHLDRIRSLKVKPHSTTIIVGENACGKSLFRQIVRTTDKKEEKVTMLHASMQLRTASNPGMGAFSGLAHDLPWLATSHSTLYCVEQIFKQAERYAAEKRPFSICIDEPEIGLGLGAQRGLAAWLFPELEKRAQQATCILVITHSPIFVKQTPKWDFLDLSINPTKDAKAWLARQQSEDNIITPDQLLAKAQTLFLTVRDRLNKSK